MSGDFLTLVFAQPISADVQRVLAAGEWSAASHSHAIHERDRIDRIAADAAILNDRQAKRIALLERERDELIEAAQAVICRWETPLWKDVPPTGEYIYRLRDAVAAARGEAE